MEASAEIQAAARRVLEENKKLRVLLLRQNVSEAEIDNHTSSSYDLPNEDPSAIVLAELLTNKKTCNGKRGCETRPTSKLQSTRSTGSIPLASSNGVRSTFGSAPRSGSGMAGTAPNFSSLSMGTDPVSPMMGSQGRTRSVESTGRVIPMPQAGDMASPGSTITPPEIPTPTTIFSFGQIPIPSPDASTVACQPHMQQPDHSNPNAQIPKTASAISTTSDAASAPYVPVVEYDQAFHAPSSTFDMTSSCTYAGEFLRRMNPGIEPELESHLGCNPQYAQCRVENTKLFGLINEFDERRL